MSLTFDDAGTQKYYLRLPESPVPSIFPVGEEEAYIAAYKSIENDPNHGDPVNIALYEVIEKKLMQGKSSRQGLKQAIDKVMKDNQIAIEQWLLNNTYHNKEVHALLFSSFNGVGAKNFDLKNLMVQFVNSNEFPNLEAADHSDKRSKYFHASAGEPWDANQVPLNAALKTPEKVIKEIENELVASAIVSSSTGGASSTSGAPISHEDLKALQAEIVELRALLHNKDNSKDYSPIDYVNKSLDNSILDNENDPENKDESNDTKIKLGWNPDSDRLNDRGHDTNIQEVSSTINPEKIKGVVSYGITNSQTIKPRNVPDQYLMPDRNAQLPHLTDHAQGELERSAFYPSFKDLTRPEGYGQWHALKMIEGIKTYVEKGGNKSPNLLMSSKEKGTIIKTFQLNKANFDKLSWWDIVDLFLRQHWHNIIHENPLSKTVDTENRLDTIFYHNGPFVLDQYQPMNYSKMVAWLLSYDIIMDDIGKDSPLHKSTTKWFTLPHKKGCLDCHKIRG